MNAPTIDDFLGQLLRRKRLGLNLGFFSPQTNYLLDKNGTLLVPRENLLCTEHLANGFATLQARGVVARTATLPAKPVRVSKAVASEKTREDASRPDAGARSLVTKSRIEELYGEDTALWRAVCGSHRHHEDPDALNAKLHTPLDTPRPAPLAAPRNLRKATR